MQPICNPSQAIGYPSCIPAHSDSAVDGIEQKKSLSGDKWKQIEEILRKSENEIGKSLTCPRSISAFEKRDTIDRQAIIKACIHKQKTGKTWLEIKQSTEFPDYLSIIRVYIREIWGQTSIEGIPTLKKCCELLDEDDGEWFRKYLQSCRKSFKNRKNSVSPKLDFIPIVPFSANYPLYPQPRQIIPPIIPIHSPIPQATSDHSLAPSKPDPIKTKVEQIKFLSDEELNLLEEILEQSEKDIRQSSPDKSITRLLNRVINRRKIFDICLCKIKYSKSWGFLHRVFTYDEDVIYSYIRRIWGQTFIEGKPTLEKCCELLNPGNSELFRKFLDSRKGYSRERGFTATVRKRKFDGHSLEESESKSIIHSQTHSSIHSHQPTPSIEEAMNHDLLSIHNTLLPSTIQSSSGVMPIQQHIEDILFPDGLPSEEEFLRSL